MKKHKVLLNEIGLFPDKEHLNLIRKLLSDEILYYSPEGSSGDTLLILCIMLYFVGELQDCDLIWKAKMIDFDTGRLIEIGLVCVKGYEATLEYAASIPTLQKLKVFLEITSNNEYRKDIILNYYKNNYGF